MKKSQLLNIVRALALFALGSSAHAAIIASDDVSIRGVEQPYADPVSVFPAAGAGIALTRDIPRDSGYPQSEQKFNVHLKRASPESAHADSGVSLWLFLIVAAVVGGLSEIFHRSSLNQ